MSALDGHQKAFVILGRAFADTCNENMDRARAEPDKRIAAMIADRAMILADFGLVFSRAAVAIDEQIKAETTGAMEQKG